MRLPSWYSKALSVAMVISGTAVTALTPYYGGRPWFDAVIAALATLGIHGTLYTPATPTAPSLPITITTTQPPAS